MVYAASWNRNPFSLTTTWHIDAIPFQYLSLTTHEILTQYPFNTCHWQCAKYWLNTLSIPITPWQMCDISMWYPLNTCHWQCMKYWLNTLSIPVIDNVQNIDSIPFQYLSHPDKCTTYRHDTLSIPVIDNVWNIDLIPFQYLSLTMCKILTWYPFNTCHWQHVKYWLDTLSIPIAPWQMCNISMWYPLNTCRTPKYTYPMNILQLKSPFLNYLVKLPFPHLPPNNSIYLFCLYGLWLASLCGAYSTLHFGSWHSESMGEI